jgi:hypothetical protein
MGNWATSLHFTCDHSSGTTERMKVRHAALAHPARTGAVIGLLVPPIFMLVMYFLESCGICGPDKCGWVIVFWPSLLIMMFLDVAHPSITYIVLIYSISIGLNMLLYAGIASLAATLCLLPPAQSN